ncbi:MAG: polyprenol monophosphomannose synthase [Chloroflexia bacterium]|nr:polyprenol monophosphomannose synthase [Chloroflexia bacterium]
MVPVTVVIPTYNERENIDRMVRDVLVLGSRYRVLVVDDSSPDGTGAIVTALATGQPGRVELLTRSRKEGIGRAYIAGFQHALASGARLIAQMDADHSHQPADLARLIDASASYDLVLASRYVDGGNTVGWPWHRKLISRAGGWYAGLILGVPVKDLTGGFKVWHRHVLEEIDLASIHSDGYCFQIETTWRAIRTCATYVQVPITFTDRVAGKSKLSRRVVIEAMIIPWSLRLRHILHRPW